MNQTKLSKTMRDKGFTGYRLNKELGYKSTLIYQLLNGRYPTFPKFRREVSELLGVEEASLFDENGALLPADEEEKDK